MRPRSTLCLPRQGSGTWKITSRSGVTVDPLRLPITSAKQGTKVESSAPPKTLLSLLKIAPLVSRSTVYPPQSFSFLFLLTPLFLRLICLSSRVVDQRQATPSWHAQPTHQQSLELQPRLNPYLCVYRLLRDTALLAVHGSLPIEHQTLSASGAIPANAPATHLSSSRG